MRVLLDGEFFAEWSGTLEELASFSDVDISRLTIDRTPDETKALIEARRWEVQTAGIRIDGMFLDTSPTSMTLVTGAALEANIDPTYTLRWKTEGRRIELVGEEIVALARAVRAHVQACFDREEELFSLVDDGTFSEELLVDFWPVQDA